MDKRIYDYLEITDLKDMLNKCKRIQPEYLPIVEVVDYEEKKFIVIWAPGGYLRPYSSPKTMAKNEKERIYYIRKMSSTIVPSEEEKRDLYNLANNFHRKEDCHEFTK